MELKYLQGSWDVKYNSRLRGSFTSPPLAPVTGLLSTLTSNSPTAHFTNIYMQTNGSGTVEGYN